MSWKKDAVVRETLDGDPTNATAMLHLGLRHHGNGEHAKAVELLRRAGEQGVSTEELHRTLAASHCGCFAESGSYLELLGAVGALEKAAADRSADGLAGDLEILLELGQLYVRTGDLDGANECVKLLLDAAAAPAGGGSSSSTSASSSAAGASSASSSSAALPELQARGLHLAACILRHSRRHKQSTQCFQRLVDRGDALGAEIGYSPNDMWLQVGRTRELDGDKTGAEDAYARSGRDPRDRSVWEHMASIYSDSDDHILAVDAFQQALSLQHGGQQGGGEREPLDEKHMAMLWFGLGDSMFHTGRVGGAIQAGQTAGKLLEDDEQVRSYMAFWADQQRQREETTRGGGVSLGTRSGGGNGGSLRPPPQRPSSAPMNRPECKPNRTSSAPPRRPDHSATSGGSSGGSRRAPPPRDRDRAPSTRPPPPPRLGLTVSTDDEELLPRYGSRVNKAMLKASQVRTGEARV